jgi:hypothetical protein
MLTFLLALQSPQASRHWGHVSRLFERTLRSVCAQTCADFRVVLVCNEKPAIDLSHPALTVIEVDYAPPTPDGRMDDKWRKLKRGLIAIREFGPTHLMITDADDCVHRSLAALAAAAPQAPGWNFEEGYMHDEGSHWLHRLARFDRYCGTSAIVRVEPEGCPRDMDESIEPYPVLRYGHGVIGDYFRDRGRPLLPLPFRGAIYNTATGENHSHISLRSWRGKKMFIKKLLNARPVTAQVRASYGLYPVPFAA